MATRTIARLFDSSTTAHAAVRSLEAAGFAHDDITYMGSANEGAARDRVGADSLRSGAGTGMPGVAASPGAATTPRTTTTGTTTDATETGAATGASLGTVVGGGAGLLAGIGALAIPGVGPLVAAGWLVATLTGAGVGAAAGGLIGSLTTAGVDEKDAGTYSEGLRRGGHLVAVRTEEGRAAEAERILEQHGPVDMESRQAEWRTDGWDPAKDPTRNPDYAGARPIGTPHDDMRLANDPTLRRPGDVA
ncbi:hypothetical protein [Falsiroseomonas sp.]|uniref:hypothetical protein n=1 Tax=Falsiroseomonas sp. TaxID=2870721 RepID=UPI002719AA8C|nr:hypothetical protein [Falsiroseomonas sp.]MDO9501656.1 hypothetical protein [Falsiroseomonas sp.]MDP3416049.1 hypothetical protein [Falsiroseomonas sp.]